jgi:hypothetical protein
VESFSSWVTLNSSVELFFIGILVLKHATSLTHKSWKLKIDLDFKLLYHVLTFPLKIVGNILYMTSLSCDQLKDPPHILDMLSGVCKSIITIQVHLCG